MSSNEFWKNPSGREWRGGTDIWGDVENRDSGSKPPVIESENAEAPSDVLAEQLPEETIQDDAAHDK